MRVTDPQVILNGEKDLIASVQKDLDLDAVRDLLKERLAVTGLSPKGGQIVVHNNDVAFRLDYEINVNGSLLFDREGNLIEDGDNTAPEPKALQNEEPEQHSNLDDDQPDNLADSDKASLNHDPGQEDQTDTDAPLILETLADDQHDDEEHDDDKQDTEPGLEIEDLEDDSAFDQDDSDMLEADDGDDLIDDLPKADGIEELPELELEDEDKNIGRDDDIVDDDISDILQESREFWEKKKE